MPDKSYVIVRLHNMLIFILRRYYVSSWDIFPEKSPSMGWSLDFLQITLYRIYTSESKLRCGCCGTVQYMGICNSENMHQTLRKESKSDRTPTSTNLFTLMLPLCNKNRMGDGRRAYQIRQDRLLPRV